MRGHSQVHNRGKKWGYRENAKEEAPPPKAKAKAQPGPRAGAEADAKPPVPGAPAQDDSAEVPADQNCTQLLVPPNRTMAKLLSKMVQFQVTVGVDAPEDVPEVGLLLEKSPEKKAAGK